MPKLEYIDEPNPGNSKYPEMLAQIKRDTTAGGDNYGKWAAINQFKSEGTARDLAYRLHKTNPSFDFISRKGEKVTVVYARYNIEAGKPARRMRGTG